MATEESEDHGHFLPAVRDWPRGYGEASWWPFVTAIGLLVVYTGASLYVIGRGTDLVSSSVGLGAFVAGWAVTILGMFGWIYQAFVVDFWDRGSHNGGASLRLGMLLFLGTDIATFGAGFAYYFFIRTGGWHTEYLPESGILTSVLVINTVLLVFSSFTIHWAEGHLQKGNHQRFVQGLLVTLLCGIVFIGGQIYEYYEFIVHEGFTLTSGVFASGFFGLTGIHGIHVSFGALLLAILLVRGLRGHYDADRHVSVTTVSWYWHFVDAIWLFLVAVVYIGSVFGTEFSPF
ncbi:cytochrome c oxidase subunit 3 [Halarchaeum nitratireducens]|uniref:Cytochrome c oxidase subunit III n=1 Tax=Halarchaeum nitratireducens TaxID=489913 RepID=A0A830GE55_9EURY|nr:heme-copper oxidase subunit III [Halarchaeum nitratireducens]GGN19392.1 cytochrome c oxidase subunit III [Halarchaeum nitratireducens]